jgi:hypothetical protein
MKEEDFFKIEKTEEFEMTEQFGQTAPESEKVTYKENDILRIENNVYHSWSGVSSCGHADRIKSECWGAVQNWAKNKIFEHSQYRYIRYGNESSRVRVLNRKPPFGARSCSASTTIPCYIEFRKI